MELTGANCILRPWRNADLASLVLNANNPKIARNLGDRFPHPYTIEHAKEWLADRANREAPYTSFAIDVGGEAVGATGFGILPENRSVTAGAGYWLGEPFWGRGIATEAFSLLTQYIFDTFPEIHRVEASVFEWNPASRRVLEKCGFTYEACMRKACIKDGEVIDLFQYAKVREP